MPWIVLLLTALITGLLQFALVDKEIPRAKWILPLIVGGVALLCWLGMIEVLPLPDTYFFDESSFISFPDYFYIGLIYCPAALFGIMMGALFGCARKG